MDAVAAAWKAASATYTLGHQFACGNNEKQQRHYIEFFHLRSSLCGPLRNSAISALK
jgi:hypothetical protein